MTGKILGKIDSVRFGFVPDRDFLFGLDLMFHLADGSSIGAGCDLMVNVSPECKWTAEERQAAMADLIDRICEILNDAKVSHVESLKNKPVEVEIEKNTYKSFRILTEVL